MKNCTRFFTQEQIDEIRMRLAAINGAKDSEFDQATYIGNNDYVAIVQDGKNKKANVSLLKQDLYEMDDVPTEGSSKPVKSNGIYEALQDIIGQITPGVSKYIYIQSDSRMFECLINGPGGIYSTDDYNQYCEQIFNALNNGYFIIIDDALCLTTYQEEPNFFRLISISNTKYVQISAHKLSGNTWSKLLGYVDTNLFLVDTKYLKQNGYTTTSNINQMLSNYVTIGNLQAMVESYPEQGSTKLVTSGGIWQAIQNAITDIFTKDEVLTITDDMMEVLTDNTFNQAYQQYCEKVYNACSSNMLIIYQDGICRYSYAETEERKTFNITVFTTRNSYNFGANKLSGNAWVQQYPPTISDNHLLKSSELTSSLSSYYTKAQIDALLATINNSISQNRNAINSNYAEYTERMASTPKYHKANWLLDEIDQKGRVTAETSVVTPIERFNSMWWAVKDSKMITFYGIPDIYRESDITTSSPDNATSITVKFFIGGIISTYTIEKKYIGNVQSAENLYLQVNTTEDQIDKVNQVVSKGVETTDNPTIVGPSVQKYTVDLSNNLDQFQSFSDITGIYDVPLIIDPNLNISPLLGDMKITKCGGLVTDKTDYINIPNILGNPALVVYGSLVDDTMLSAGGITISIDNNDNLVITYREINGTVHSLTVDNNIINDQIASFLNSILKNFNIIRDTNALSFLLSIFQCTVQFNGITQGTNFFIRTNNSYQLCAINQVSLLEIAEI